MFRYRLQSTCNYIMLSKLLHVKIVFFSASNRNLNNKEMFFITGGCSVAA